LQDNHVNRTVYYCLTRTRRRNVGVLDLPSYALMLISICHRL